MDREWIFQGFLFFCCRSWTSSEDVIHLRRITGTLQKFQISKWRGYHFQSVVSVRICPKGKIYESSGYPADQICLISIIISIIINPLFLSLSSTWQIIIKALLQENWGPWVRIWNNRSYCGLLQLVSRVLQNNIKMHKYNLQTFQEYQLSNPTLGRRQANTWRITSFVFTESSCSSNMSFFELRIKNIIPGLIILLLNMNY